MGAPLPGEAGPGPRGRDRQPARDGNDGRHGDGHCAYNALGRPAHYHVVRAEAERIHTGVSSHDRTAYHWLLAQQHLAAGHGDQSIHDGAKQLQPNQALFGSARQATRRGPATGLAERQRPRAAGDGQLHLRWAEACLERPGRCHSQRRAGRGHRQSGLWKELVFAGHHWRPVPLGECLRRGSGSISGACRILRASPLDFRGHLAGECHHDLTLAAGPLLSLRLCSWPGL
mmetsp:Transcript_36898/g.88136  ORF Transcript_36898/g.88136 Transcript_36898/m.88136 type:complete len:230 (+) Transcript_36898:127-816(+)